MPAPLKFDSRSAGAISVGIEFVISVLLGLYAGRWIGQRLGNETAGTLVGIGFGSAAGFRSLLRVLREQSARDDDPGTGPPPAPPSDPGTP